MGELGVSIVVLGSSYLKRLFAALVVAGATKLGSPDPTLSPGGASKDFKN